MCGNFIASVVIRLLSIQIGPERLQTHCGCLFRRISPCSDSIQICPRSVLLFDGRSLGFILRRAFSLSPLPLAFVAQARYQPLTSPENLQNCAPTLGFFFFKTTTTTTTTKISDEAPAEPFAKRRSPQKCQNLGSRKRDREAIIPRRASTLVAGEKATPAVTLASYSLHRAYTCVHTEENTHVYSSKTRRG